MRIGIDIDGVLTNIEQFCFDYFLKHLVENNIEYNVSSSSYDIYKTFGITPKQEDEFWDKYLFFYSSHEKARTFSAEIIKKLKSEGNEIYIITARWLANRDDKVGEKMRKTVKKWLSKNKICYDKLIFSRASNQSKVDEISENKIDIMIEDNPNNIKELSKIIPIICCNANYNVGIEGKNIIRCYGWYDIYKHIKNLEK